MPFISPGIAFLGRGFAYLSIFVGAIVGVTRVAASHGFFVPIWLAITGSLGALPTIAGINYLAGEFKKKRRAAALGARIVPKVQGKWIGNIDVLNESLRNLEIGYPGDGLNEVVEKRGPTFNLSVLWSDLVLTICPEHIKAILATDFQNYVKGERFHNNMASVLGTGVFNSDGEMWKFHRGITRPVFTRDRIGDFDIFDRHTDQVIVKLKERLREGYSVDFQDIMARFTLDTATEFLFGHCVHSLSAGLPYPSSTPSYIQARQQTPQGRAADEFAHAFLQAQEVISVRERSGWVWPLFEMWEDKTKKPMRVVNSYVEPIVRDAIERKRNEPIEEQGKDEKELQEHQSLLDHLISITRDPVVLKDEILNIMIAGRDTTASTLTFVVYLLSQHPNVTNRLREEILQHVGPSRRPNFEDLKDMKYLRAVINETLRLFPIVPFNVRETINETTWVSPDPTEKPLYIPPGTKTAYSVFMMHRRKDLWGPDAEEFDPDRFLDERLKKYLIKNSFIFLPFNAGPRICLGQQYAYNEMSFMLIRLLQNFSSISLELPSAPKEAIPPAAWAKAEGRKAIEKVFPKMHLTLYTNGGLWVKMQESQDN